MTTKQILSIAVLSTAAVLTVPAFTLAQENTRFTVRIENVSTTETLKLSNGMTAPAPVSPGVWALFKGASNPLFMAGKSATPDGLERQAEEGNASAFFATVKTRVKKVGTFTTPVGESRPGGLLPGKAYEFTIEAMADEKLVITMMFAQSNDLFWAPASGSLNLFDTTGKPLTGDVTMQFALWDAGTEINQEPGAGPDQAPRQKAPNTGAVENGVVHLVKDQFTYPNAGNVIRVTLTPAASKSMR